MNQSKKISVLLIVSLLLVGCGFLATTKTDMQEADEEMAGYAANGSYEEYSSKRFSELHGNEKFILFFSADWCPLCRVLEGKIKKDMDVLNGHAVLEANYDKEVELKKEYSVLVQTTMIFFNADGTIADKKVNPRLSMIEEFFK